MSQRIILRNSQHSSTAAREMLNLLFSAELLNPAPEFWMAMAWVSDVSLFDSIHKEFDALLPGNGSGRLSLSDVLSELARSGSVINVITRPDPINEKFIDALRRKVRQLRIQSPVRICLSSTIHQKNLVGNDWYSDGSMNLTVNGLDHNVENLSVYLDPARVAEMRTNLRQTWSGLLEEIND